MAYINNFMAENARIIFRNFSGAPTKFNAAGGKRTFGLVVDSETAGKLTGDGWNVKHLRPRDEEDGEGTYYLPCEVSYRARPPKIWMIVGRKKTLLTEETIGSLDYSDIKTIDIVVTPYKWEFAGKEGVKAYVKDMYVVIEEDYFSSKYDFEDEPAVESDFGPDDVPF